MTTTKGAPVNKPIDIQRAKRGAKQLYMRGLPNTDRRKRLIEEAIIKIMTDPRDALSKGFIGFKNYASFGDQRHDCQYGYGPRHGSIVFEIGACARGPHEPFDADAVYYLECERDFVPYPAETAHRGQGEDSRPRNLWDALNLHSRRTTELNRIQLHLEAATVEEEAVR